MVSFGTQSLFSTAHIQIRQLNKYYEINNQRIHALKEINLDIPQGRILGIIGKSGAGKSSLLRTLNGLEPIDTGSIHIEQQQIEVLNQQQLNRLRQKIGMIFQHFNLLSAKTVWENIALPLKIAGTDRSSINTQVEQMLALVGLSDKAQHYPAQLSGGQKQRVGIARALVNQPELLLCDEATSALDPESTASILALLKKINQQFGITIVLITHEMQVIREICDQVVVIDQGEIVESGQVWSVFSQPQQCITQELLNLDSATLDFHIYADKTQVTALNQPLTHSILKLKYAVSAAHCPDLSAILQAFEAPVHLYQSQVDQIQNHVVGCLLLAVANLALDFNTLRQRLDANSIQLEVLGYARPTH